jgi:hypothetical protein
MLAVISCLGVVLLLGASLLNSTLRIDRSERARVVVAGGLQRFANDLRTDAHASAGEIKLDEKLCRISLGDGKTVEYLVRPKDILRSVKLASKVQGVEIYRLPTGTMGRFERLSNDGPSMIQLSIKPATGQLVDPGYRDYHVVARLGRGGQR